MTNNATHHDVNLTRTIRGQGHVSTFILIEHFRVFLRTHLYQRRPPDRNEFNQTLAHIKPSFHMIVDDRYDRWDRCDRYDRWDRCDRYDRWG